MTVEDRVLDTIKLKPHLTEIEISRRLFGEDAVQQQVNPSCRALVAAQKVKRTGKGGGSDPFTYTVL